MWNKKREDEPQRPTYTPPAPPAQPPAVKPVEAKKEMPVSSMQPARFEPDVRSGNSATIGKSVKVIGQIFSREDLFVDGEVEGTLEALEHKLTIGPNGIVRATIKAREVHALGNVRRRCRPPRARRREAVCAAARDLPFQSPLGGTRW